MVSRQCMEETLPHHGPMPLDCYKELRFNMDSRKLDNDYISLVRVVVLFGVGRCLTQAGASKSNSVARSRAS